MKEGQQTYFVDEVNLSFELPKGAICFTSALSSDLDLEKVDLDASTNARINKEAWDEVIDFYNTHRTHFETFDRREGFNIWFFLNFRLYFEWRNDKLRIATIDRFIEMHADGILITADKSLVSRFPNSEIILSSKEPAGKPKKSKIKRVAQELSYILFSKGENKSIEGDTVILSKAEDLRDNKNRRFHLLEDHYESLSVRSVFDMSNPLNRASASFDQSLNINRILARYIMSLGCIGNYRRFTKSLDQLNLSINPRHDGDVKILALLKKHRSAYIIYHLIYRAYLKYFKGSKVKNMLISDENSPQTRSIIEAAKKTGIKTFAFQHGTIHDLHPAYIFGKYEGEVPLPTKTFVWGDHYSDLLKSSGGYRDDQVYPSGRLPVYVNQTLHPSIDDSRNTIVFATQPQRNPALRRRQLEDVMYVAQQLSQSYQLVIRPHPRENDDAYFQDIAQSLDFTDFILDRKSDLLSHFECCAVMITSFSTVGLEFIPYKKPMLVLDYMKEDLIGYIANKVGVPIYGREDLMRVLSQSEINIDKAAFDKYLAQFNRPNPDIVADLKKMIASPDL